VHDVAVIGGGPGGSTAGYVLARAGRRVVVLERERFPRFHIGESLLPLSRYLYDRLDLASKIEAQGYVKKYGAQFLSIDGAIELAFDFSRGTEDPYRIAFEVERDHFDRMLLDHARGAGAEVREGTTVLDVETSESSPCRLRVRGPEGESTIEARWVIDASGQGSMLAKKFGLRVEHPTHKKVAIFSRYRGMPRRPARQAGNIDLVLGNRCWFWLIPLRDDGTSVGCVANTSEWKASGDAPEDFLKRKIGESPYVSKRVGAAPRCEDVHVAANYAYTSSRFTGPGYALVGDAAAFLDPIFSTGVMLAMRSGEMAARLVAERMASGRAMTEGALAPYERQFAKWMRIHFRMIDAFYSEGFGKLFLKPSNKFGLVDTVLRLLAGDSDMGFADRLRLNLFYALLWLNRKLGFAKDPRTPEAALPHG
jgi:FADH2-dependent halogenase